MKEPDKIAKSYAFVTKSRERSADIKNPSFTAFLISLLPIPVLSQSAAFLDRITTDKASKIALDNLWMELTQTNKRIEALAD